MLFDGGYYSKADSVLKIIDREKLDADEKVELNYRLARVAHMEGKIEKAKKYYAETIENGSFSERYFAGNSALKLGEIYEQENNRQKALFYYELCLNIDFDEYENSIHSKAKAGIERLSDKD